jgi:hypothetical protein
VRGIPPDGVENAVGVDDSPQALHVAEPEPKELVDVVEFELPKALLRLWAEDAREHGVVLAVAAALAVEHLRADLGPSEPLHVSEELDDFSQGFFAGRPRPAAGVLEVEERQAPLGVIAVRRVRDPEKALRARHFLARCR